MNAFLFMKQGFKDIFRNKLQLFIIILLTLLSSSFLSASISAYQNLTTTYNTSFKNKVNADYYDTQKMFYTDGIPNTQIAENSFTPVYDLLPSYIDMNSKDGFQIQDEQQDKNNESAYELFLNNDKAVYVNSVNNQSNGAPITLDPFTPLYTDTNDNWLGIKSQDLQNFFSITFDSENNANILPDWTKTNTPVINGNIVETEMTTFLESTLEKYVSYYINYVNNQNQNDSEKSIAISMGQSIFKDSLIAKFIIKNKNILKDASSNTYKQLIGEYIKGIADNIGTYIYKSLYTLLQSYALTFINAWNNGYYTSGAANAIRSSLGYSSSFDLMQADINGQLYNETKNEDFALNKSSNSLPLSVTSDGVDLKVLHAFNINDAFEYITGLKANNYTPDNNYKNNFTDQLFIDNLYDETKNNYNINTNVSKHDNSSNLGVTGTKGISSYIITSSVSTDNNPIMNLVLGISNDSLIFYSGYQYFLGLHSTMYSNYVIHMYYSGNVSDFTSQRSLSMQIQTKDITYSLVSYKNSFVSSADQTDGTKNLDIVLYSGTMPKFENDVVISPTYAKVHHIHIGDNIVVGNKIVLTVTGIGISPYQLYPMIDPLNPIINSSSQAILYCDGQLIQNIDYKFKSEYSTSLSTYYTYNGNIKNKDSNYLNLLAYNNYSNSYLNYANTIENNITNSNDINNFANTNFMANGLLKNFSSTNIPKYESGLFSKSDKYFLFINIFISIMILLVSLIAVVIMTHNNIKGSSKEIGVLKALGVKKWKLIVCHTMFSFVVMLSIPLGFLIGVFLQFIFIDDFTYIFSVTNNHITFGWISLIMTLCIIGLFTIITGIIVANDLIDKPIIELFSARIKQKKSKIAIKINNLLRKRNFNIKFIFNLAYTSSKRLTMFGGVMLFASIAITMTLSLPSIITTISNQYNKVETFSNSYNYESPVFNNPLSRIDINNWVGENDLSNDWTPNTNNTNDNSKLGTFKSIDDYYKINSNASLTPNFAKSSSSPNWNWGLDQMVQDNFGSQDLLNLFLQSVLQPDGKALGNYTFDEILSWISKYYGVNSDVYGRYNLFLEATLASLVKEIFNYTGTDQNWRDTIINSALNTLPSFIDEYLESGISRESYSIGWGYTNYQANKDTLITELNDALNIGKNTYSNVNEIGLPENQNDINLSSAEKNDIYATSDIEKELSPGQNTISNNKIIIPVIATKAAQIHYQLQLNQLVKTQRNMPELQFLANNGKYAEIDPTWWKYDDGGNMTNLYDYTNKVDGSEFDYNKTTYFTGSSNDFQEGYAKWNNHDHNFAISNYYNPKNIVLQIPTNMINLSQWIGPYTTNYQRDQLFSKSSDGKFYYFHPYNYDVVSPNYQEKNVINIFEDKSSDSVDDWYHYACSQGLLKDGIYNASTLVGPNSTVNHNQNIYFKVVGFIKEYDKNNLYMNQSVANLLNGYDDNKLNFYNYQPSTQRTKNGGLLFNKDDAELSSSQEPYAWFNSKLSNSNTLDYATYYSMYSDTSDYSMIQISEKTDDDVTGTETVQNIDGLMKILEHVGLGISIPIIISIIICSVILVLLITTMFIDDNIRYMTFMKIEGYNKKEIITYILSIFTPIFIIAFMIGYLVVTLLIELVFFMIHHIWSIACPYQYSPWTLLVCLILTSIIYAFALVLVNQRFDKYKMTNLTS